MSSLYQTTLSVRRVCAPTLYWLRMRPVVRISGKLRLVRSGVGHEVGQHEAALAARELVRVHDRRTRGRGVVARPLDAAELVEPLEADALEGRRDVGDLVHDRRSRRVAHGIAHRGRDAAHDLPLGHALLLLHHRAHAIDAPLGVGEGAVLLQERGARQEYVREGRRLVEEEVLHDEDLQGLQRVGHVLGVGVGLGDILALHEQALEGAARGLVEHVGNAQAGLGIELLAPHLLEQLAGPLVRDVAVARVLVRERAHVAGALHVVLPAQRVHAHALAADVAGRHGEVGHSHHHGGALAVLGDAESVIDGGVATRRE